MYGPGTRVHRRGDYIFGSFVRPVTLDGWVNAINPGDRSDAIGRFGFGLRSVDEAVGAARRGVTGLAELDAEQRAALLLQLADRFEEEAEGLATLIARETGKPLWDAASEVKSARRVARLLASEGRASLREHVVQEGHTWSVPRPHGVVGIITPYTLPLLLPVMSVGAALLAGNAVVFKPSKFAPATGQALAIALDRLRLPRGAFNLVQGPGSQVGERLAGHPGIDALTFIGRNETADQIRRLNAHRPSFPVLLQTGGKAAAIVLGDADLDRAAYEIATGAAAMAGQRHDGTARVYVVRRRADAFLDALVRRVRGLVVGYGFDGDVFFGPMISDAHRRAYRRSLAALHERADVRLEGGAIELDGRRGFYVRPDVSVVEDDDPTEVPVGPSLRVIVVDDADEAVERAASLSYRGVVSLFSSAPDEAARLAQRLPFGAVHVNRGTTGGSLRLASVPRGRSGNGVSGGLDAVRFLAPAQAVVIDRRPHDDKRHAPGAGAVVPSDEDAETEEAPFVP